jgi:RND family efflux transporter MFP subunit
MNPRLRNILIALGIVVGAVAITAGAILLRPEPPRSEPEERIPSVTTVVAVAWSEPLPVTGAGTVRPTAEVDLAPQVAGRVEWVSPDFVSGGRVTRGNLLVRIEPADYENRVAQAEAQVAQDRVGLLQAEEEARIALDEFRRFQARSGATGDPSPLTLREPQLEAARAALLRSEAQLRDARLALDRTEIRAPFDGVVRSETVDPGDLAAVGQPFGRLYASESVEVIVPLADSDAGLLEGLWDLRAGRAEGRLAARVTTSVGARRFVWDGYVDRAEAALDEQTRTIDVVVRVPAPFRPGRPVDASDPVGGPPLLVGQFVDVEMEGRVGEFFRIPRTALRVDDEVWVVEEGRVRIVPVDVVQRLDADLFVRGDLEDDAAVITGGVAVATEGMVVEIAEGADR